MKKVLEKIGQTGEVSHLRKREHSKEVKIAGEIIMASFPQKEAIVWNYDKNKCNKMMNLIIQIIISIIIIFAQIVCSHNNPGYGSIIFMLALICHMLNLIISIISIRR